MLYSIRTTNPQVVHYHITFMAKPDGNVFLGHSNSVLWNLNPDSINKTTLWSGLDKINMETSYPRSTVRFRMGLASELYISGVRTSVSWPMSKMQPRWWKFSIFPNQPVFSNGPYCKQVHKNIVLFFIIWVKIRKFWHTPCQLRVNRRQKQHNWTETGDWNWCPIALKFPLHFLDCSLQIYIWSSLSDPDTGKI